MEDILQQYSSHIEVISFMSANQMDSVAILGAGDGNGSTEFQLDAFIPLAFSVSLLVICTISLVFGIICFVSVIFEKHQSSVSYVNDLSLLSAGLFMSLVCVLLTFMLTYPDSFTSYAACTLVGCLCIFTFISYILNLLVSVACAHYKITKPFKSLLRKTTRATFVAVAVLWLVSFIGSFIPILWNQYKPVREDDDFICNPLTLVNRLYFFVTVDVILIPVLVAQYSIAFLILWKAHKRRKELRNLQNNSNSLNGQLLSRYTVFFLLMVHVLFVTWIPVIVTVNFMYFCPQCVNYFYCQAFVTICLTLAAIGPPFHTLRVRKHRQSIRQYFSPNNCWQKTVMRMYRSTRRNNNRVAPLNDQN
ncbi:adenosine receptor A1-like [Ptychodera flava]|uniref:adenosine receptor A1-like n=1 Tax=Ptychodera flava TaxID=63121 RepID=UPI00396A9E37